MPPSWQRRAARLPLLPQRTQYSPRRFLHPAMPPEIPGSFATLLNVTQNDLDCQNVLAMHPLAAMLRVPAACACRDFVGDGDTMFDVRSGRQCFDPRTVASGDANPPPEVASLRASTKRGWRDSTSVRSN